MNVEHISNTFDLATGLWALGGASVVTIAAQLIKKVFGLNSVKVVQFLVVSLGFAVAGLQYLLSQHNLPPTVLGLHTVALIGIAQPLYVYVIKPLDSFFTKVQSYNAAQNTPIQQVAQTVTPLSVEPTSVQADF